MDGRIERRALSNAAFTISEIVTPNAAPDERVRMAEWLSKANIHPPVNPGIELFLGSGNPITDFVIGPSEDDVNKMAWHFAEKYGLEDPTRFK